jgi:hypothetical protein
MCSTTGYESEAVGTGASSGMPRNGRGTRAGSRELRLLSGANLTDRVEMGAGQGAQARTSAMRLLSGANLSPAV